MSVKIWKVIFKRGGVPPKTKISEEKVRRHLDSNPGFSRQKFHLPGFLSSTLTRLKKEAQPLGFELGPLASDVFNLTKKPFVAFKGEEKGKTDKTEHCSTCRRAYSSRSSTMTTQCLKHRAGFDPGRIGHL